MGQLEIRWRLGSLHPAGAHNLSSASDKCQLLIPFLPPLFSILYLIQAAYSGIDVDNSVNFGEMLIRL